MLLMQRALSSFLKAVFSLLRRFRSATFLPLSLRLSRGARGAGLLKRRCAFRLPVESLRAYFFRAFLGRLRNNLSLYA